MEKMSALIEKISSGFPQINLHLNEPMKNHTSFRIGGTVSAIYFPDSAKEVADICKFAREFDINTLVLGNGTNLLVQDGHLELLVIKTYDGLGGIHLTGKSEITAGSGVLLSRLAVFAQEHGLSGLEFAHGIPGTLGGAVAMNAGAYGGEMRDVVYSTNALNSEFIEAETFGDEHEFAYRHSKFSDRNDIILSSVLRLVPGDPSEIKVKMDELSKKRRASQPLNMASAGSTFKRPKDGYAAALIEQAGLKGFTHGGAQVSEKHAGFVVNRGDATFDDVLFLIEHIQETVFKAFGVMLEPEIKIIR